MTHGVVMGWSARRPALAVFMSAALALPAEASPPAPAEPPTDTSTTRDAAEVSEPSPPLIHFMNEVEEAAWSAEAQETWRVEASRRIAAHRMAPIVFALRLGWIDYDAAEYGLWLQHVDPLDLTVIEPISQTSCPMCTEAQLVQAADGLIDAFIRDVTKPRPAPAPVVASPRVVEQPPTAPTKPPRVPLERSDIAALTITVTGLTGMMVGSGLLLSHNPRLEEQSMTILAVTLTSLGLALLGTGLLFIEDDRVRARAERRRQRRARSAFTPMGVRF